MAGKITDYPPMTLLKSGDLIDVSDFDGVATYTSKSLDYDDLITSLEGDITFRNLYTNDGTIGTGRVATLTDTLSFLSGQVIAAASTAGYASLNIPSGVDPSSPVDGDLWFNGTNLYFRDGATSIDLLGGDGNGMFDAANNGTGWGVTAFNIPATVVATHASVSHIEWKTQNNGTSHIFNTAAVNKNNNLVWQDFGTNVGQMVYDNVSSGTRGDGFKFYAKTTFSTDGETLAILNNDNVIIPNGNLGVNTDTPTDKLQVVGTVNATRYKVNGVAGANFGPGAVTSITVVDGLVTAIS